MDNLHWLKRIISRGVVLETNDNDHTSKKGMVYNFENKAEVINTKRSKTGSK